MKKIYLILLFVLPTLASAQFTSNDVVKENNNKQGSTEIVDLKLYPNPVTSNVVYITTKNNETKEIVVFDVFGKPVLKEKVRTNYLDVSNLNKGVYIMRIKENENTSTRKLVIR